MFIFISLFYPYFFLGLLSNDSRAISYGIDYLDIAVYSFVFAVVKGIIANSLKIVKITKIQVITSVIAVILNVIFNYLFIFTFSMGVMGAAIATTLVRGIELIFYVFYTVFNKNSHFYLKVKHLKIKPVIFSQLIRFFIPIFLNEFIWFFGIFWFNCYFCKN